MKFDMTKAFDDGMAILSANLTQLIALAGVFVFLPSLMLNVMADPTAMQNAPQDDPEVMQEVMLAFFQDAAPWFALYFVVSFIGTLAMLAFLGDRGRITVGDAIKTGVIGFLPLLIASILIGLLVSAVVVILTLPAALVQAPAMLLLLIPIMLVVIAFFYTRFVMVAPVMAIERSFNPLTALARSWELVKGNTRWVFLFLLLVGVAVMVVYLPITFLGQGLGALMGSPSVALWVNGIIAAFAGTAISILTLCLNVAIYRQLAGPDMRDTTEAFE